MTWHLIDENGIALAHGGGVLVCSTCGRELDEQGDEPICPECQHGNELKRAVRGPPGPRRHTFDYTDEDVLAIIGDRIDEGELPEGMTKEDFASTLAVLMLQNLREHFFGEIRWFCNNGDGIEAVVEEWKKQREAKK